MASKAPATQDAAPKDPSRALETVLIEGDLSVLSPDERIRYYHAVCDSLGLNPLTKPFEYIRLNNRLVLYAKRDCTDQLRKLNRISIRLGETRTIQDVYVVMATATEATGREDWSTGAVNIKGLVGENLANAMMKAETKAKRRVTLSIVGLGMLDETEISIEASTRAATRPAVSRKPADDLAEFAGENPPKQIAEPPPPAHAHDAETGEIVDIGERPFAIKLGVGADGVSGKEEWTAWCSDYRDALMAAECEDDLLAIVEQNKDVMLTMSATKAGAAAADRLRAVFTGCQLELRRKAAAA
jgi:hypothetical protein